MECVGIELACHEVLVDAALHRSGCIGCVLVVDDLVGDFLEDRCDPDVACRSCRNDQDVTADRCGSVACDVPGIDHVAVCRFRCDPDDLDGIADPVCGDCAADLAALDIRECDVVRDRSEVGDDLDIADGSGGDDQCVVFDICALVAGDCPGCDCEAVAVDSGEGDLLVFLADVVDGDRSLCATTDDLCERDGVVDLGELGNDLDVTVCSGRDDDLAVFDICAVACCPGIDDVTGILVGCEGCRLVFLADVVDDRLDLCAAALDLCRDDGVVDRCPDGVELDLFLGCDRTAVVVDNRSFSSLAPSCE